MERRMYKPPNLLAYGLKTNACTLVVNFHNYWKKDESEGKKLVAS